MMKPLGRSRRDFLKAAARAMSATAMSSQVVFGRDCNRIGDAVSSLQQADNGVDYALHIKASPVEIAPKRIVSMITYNGQFPGPLLRFREGREVTVDIHNETDTPEQLHWHGQKVSTDVDGAAEEGTPYIPAHGMRRIRFTPQPAGLRFYHTHNRAAADLHAGQYSGQVGAVYIEAEDEPGRHDREV